MEEELKDNKVQESDKKDEEVSEMDDFLSPQNSLSDQDDEFAEDEMEGSNESPPSAVSAAAGNRGSNVPPPSAVSAAVGTESQQEEDAESEREEDEEEGSNVPPPSAVSEAVNEGSKDTEPKEDGNHQPSLSASLEKIDDLKGEMADLMVKSLDPEKYKDNGGGEDYEPFDKLEDLVKKKAGKERKKGRKTQKENSAEPEGGNPAGNGPGEDGSKEADQAKDDTPQGVKKKVDNLRGGQLYMAVVLARQLERGGQNPLADNRFKRFFKSSSFDSVTDKIGLAGTVNTTAGLMNADYKNNPVAQAVTLATSMVALVKTIKSIVEKIKKFKSAKGKTEKFMGVIGLISDFATAISKGVAIVQSIASLSGKLTDSFKSVLGYITVFANGASQIGGFITGAHGLSTARKKLNMMKNLESKRWEDIEKTVLPKYSEPGAVDAEEEEEEEEDSGEGASTPSTAQTAQKATGEGAEKKHLSLKEKREQAKQLKQMRKERQSQANMLLRREDVSDEDKDKLVAYIASCRMAGKIKSGIRMGISGLVATALGLGTSIATGVSFTGDKSALKASTHMGIISGFMGGGLSLAKMGAAKSNQKRQNNEETDMIKGRLWGHIHSLDDDKYGLKGLSEALEVDPSPERAEEAKGVVSKYEAVDGQLRGAFVDYGAVLKANSAEEFRKLLVAGL